MPERCTGMQRSRRGFLARLRNLLLAQSLRQEDHVLWVDADIVQIPRPLLPALLASGVIQGVRFGPAWCLAQSVVSLNVYTTMFIQQWNIP